MTLGDAVFAKFVTKDGLWKLTKNTVTTCHQVSPKQPGSTSSRLISSPGNLSFNGDCMPGAKTYRQKRNRIIEERAGPVASKRRQPRATRFRLFGPVRPASDTAYGQT